MGGRNPPLDYDDDTSSSITPPSSPVLGYSGARNQNNVVSAAADSESELFIFCFCCKGAPRIGYNDHSFAPHSLILRRQLISAVELLSPLTTPSSDPVDEYDHRNHDILADSSSVLSSSAHGCYFHRTLDPMDPVEAKFLLNLARKNIHTLQILSNPQNYNSFEGDDEVESPWELRRQVLHYFNVIVSRISKLKTTLWTSVDELDAFFFSFKEAFGGDGGWPSYLKAYTGNKDGNDCSLPIYHLFHTMLDIRWSLLLIYGMNSQILSWIISDLIQLAWTMFTLGNEHHITQNQTHTQIPLTRTPFNCWCAKELWTMIRLLCEELNINFWNALSEPLHNFTKSSVEDTTTSIFFPLWLTTHLSTLSNYCLSGLYTPSREQKEPELFKFNGYPLINSLMKRWVAIVGQSVGATSRRTATTSSTQPCEVYHLLHQLTQYWGFDLEISFLLWNHWLVKVDKIMDDVGSSILENYASVDKWFKVIQSISPLTPSASLSPQKRLSSSFWPHLEMDAFVSRDPFLSFLKVLVSHATLAKGTDWKKLKSHIGMNLNKNSVGNFGEIGLIRVTTLYLSLAWATSDTTSMCDRLKEILTYGKPTPTRTKTLLRSTSTAVYLLLQKSLPISAQEVTTSLMSTVTNLLSQATLDPTRKESISVYLDLLDSLPKTPPLSPHHDSSLCRELLISPNLTMWLTSCGPNHVVRTLRTLSNLTNWIISPSKNDAPTLLPSTQRSKEGEIMASKIAERTTQFLTQAVILSANRIPSTDVEPMSNLAADLTLLSKWNGNPSTSTSRLFDHFALSERTCPEVSQFYSARLLAIQGDTLHSIIRFGTWCQVWIRLNALDCCISEHLNQLVLGPGYSSTSNSDLLRKLCSLSVEWSRGELQNILRPLPILAKSVITGSIFKNETASSKIASVFRACTQVLRGVEFDRVYAKGDTVSIGVQLISHLIPPFVGMPPWEKLQKWVLSALEGCLFDIFKAIVAAPGFSTDPFLQRKTNDLVTFALLGYLEFSPEEMTDDHPGLKILIYSEDTEIQYVLNSCIPNLSSIAGKDIKLNTRLIHAITLLKSKGLTSTLMRFLPGVLSTFVHTSPTISPELANSCSGIILYCCAFGLTPAFKDVILTAFDSVMEATFAFKSRRWFDLTSILGGKNVTRLQIKKFLKQNLLPLYTRHVRSCEQRRGTGTDKSLRDPLEKLERDTSGF